MESWRNFKQFIKAHQLLSAGDSLLVAVSGGQDSVALLHFLCELRKELELHLEVAHLQHGMRGEEARQDGRFVGELAHELGLPFHLAEVSVPEIRGKAGKGNLEALAREARYRFFAETAAARGLGKVATAHTLDDQAETVVMRFLRGSGMKGLGGMAPLTVLDSIGGAPCKLTVIRPLLETSKAEIINYLMVKNQTFRLDRTNGDIALLRNWVRLDLLPKIQERFGSGLDKRLAQQAELMRGEDALLDELAQRRVREISIALGLSRDGLLAEPIAMQRRLLRLWIEAARRNLRGLDFVHIDELLRLIQDGPPQGRLAIPGGWELARQYDRLTLVRRSPLAKRPCYAYDFTAGSTLAIAGAGWEVRSEFVEPPLARMPAQSTEALFDVAGLTGPLTVRNFRNGDFIQPLGMTGHKKIKDLFIEHKLPLSRRAMLPLLVLGSEVLWVPGCGRSEHAKVTAATASILRLKLVEMNC
ncbi:MAG: tRNA lysidine(34) synthetase TilS [Deltaproteobacteria bacterium]|nr:tRNA lysidine(34) synthetase TilS [Deltaproteobacteria bacterium]